MVVLNAKVGLLDREGAKVELVDVRAEEADDTGLGENSNKLALLINNGEAVWDEGGAENQGRVNKTVLSRTGEEWDSRGS